MFGKRHLTCSSRSLSKDYQQIDESPSNKFIFYNSEEQFQQKIEFYAVLSSDPSKKILTIIDTTASLDYLQIKITEAFEQFAEYKTLEGLKAVNIHKKKEDDTKLMLPLSSDLNINEFITNGDFVYCDLIAKEYWLECVVNMKTKHDYLYYAFKYQMKIKHEMTFRMVKTFVIKTALNQWSEFVIQKCKSNKTSIKSYYVYQVLFSADDTELIDNSRVNSLFHFNSQIKCNMILISFEDRLFMHLKKIEPVPNYETKLKWIEFKEMTFFLLQLSTKYKKEHQWMKAFIKRMIHQNRNSVWYVYNNKMNRVSLRLYPDDSKHEHVNMNKSYTISNNNVFEKLNDGINESYYDIDNDNCNIRKRLLVLTINDGQSQRQLNNFIKENLFTSNARKYYRKPQAKGKKTFIGKVHEYIDSTSFKPDSKEDNIMYIDTFLNENLLTNGQSKTYISKQSQLASSQKTSVKDTVSSNPYTSNSKNARPITGEDFEISFHSSTNLNEELSKKIIGAKRKVVTPSRYKFTNILKQYRNSSEYFNLCSEFRKNCTIEEFMKTITPMYEVNYELGYLDKVILPKTRGFEEVKHEDLVNNEGLSIDSEYIEYYNYNKYKLKEVMRKVVVFVGGMFVVFIVWIVLLIKNAELLVGYLWV